MDPKQPWKTDCVGDDEVQNCSIVLDPGGKEKQVVVPLLNRRDCEWSDVRYISLVTFRLKFW